MTHPHETSPDAVDLIVSATFRLADQRTWAWVLILGRAPLDHVVETGTAISARLSEELLLAIFSRGSPLNDSLAVVRGGEVVAAGCVFPTMQDDHVVWNAPIHLTKESDCMVVIVSEERGTVSLARGGVLTDDLAPDALRAVLREHCAQSGPSS